MSDIQIGLVGFGYWGSKLARNIHDVSRCELMGICEDDAYRRASGLARYPEARGFEALEAMLADPHVEAVMLATPASRHAEHAIAALRAGKHVFVEKPLALTTADSDEIVAEARAADRTLMVGHTFLYAEPVRYLRQLIQEDELGQVLYVYGQRVNLGIIREDLNALWNFGPHDVSIMLYLLGANPISVSARQFPVLNRRLEDVAFLVVEFPDGTVGHIHTSWLDPRKVRQYTVVGSRKMVVYDDTDVELPLRIYDNRVRQMPIVETNPPDHRFPEFQPDQGFGEFQLQVRAGDVLAPRIEGREPLRTEVEHFVHCVRTGAVPLTDGAHGREVVAVLEAAERSAAEGGLAIPISVHDRASA
jgi:predicted dehydrogenase